MRGRNLVTFLKLIDLLSRREGATLDDLVEGLKLDRRSVYRQLAIVEELGFPVVDEKDPGDGRKIRKRLLETFQKKLPNMTVPAIHFTPAEILALFLLKGEGRVFRNTEVGERIDHAFSKIAAMAPASLPGGISKIGSLFVDTSKMAKDYAGKGEIIERLTGAILTNLICNVTYNAFTKDTIKTFTIHPLHFCENSGGLYLFVLIPKYGDIRLLAVERILELEVSSESFQQSEDFNPDQLLNGAFNITFDGSFPVKIWFAERQKRYIQERTWSTDQQIDEQQDGSIVLAMTTSGRRDIKSWVLSMAGEAELLEPQDLRDEIRTELRQAMERYQNA